MNKNIILKITTLSISVIMMTTAALAITDSAKAVWVGNPTNCLSLDPLNWPGVNCSPWDLCGGACYDTSTLMTPATQTSFTQFTTSLAGGFVTNCDANDGSGALCDNGGNFWCNADASCMALHVLTSCTNWLTFSCSSTCMSGYTYCDGSSTDGNGCEVQIDVTPGAEAGTVINGSCGLSCTTNKYDCDADLGLGGTGCETNSGTPCTDIFGNPGTISCTANASGSCTDGSQNYDCSCNVSPISFLTGVNTSYGSSTPLLQGTQSGTGALIQLGNNTTSNLFSINNDGSVFLNQITAPTTTTDLLYNVGGNLFWNGSPLVSGSTVDLDGDTKIQVEESADEDYIRFDTAGNEVGYFDPAGDFTLSTGDLFLTLGDIFFGSIGLKDLGTDAATSGASVIGVYDEFDNSDAANLQDVLDDLDNKITNGVNINKTITKKPMYELSILVDGSDNAANMDFDFFGRGAYRVTTSKTSTQDIDTYLDIPIPHDFVSLQDPAVEIDIKSSTNTTSDASIEVIEATDSSGANVTIQCNGGACSETASSTWTTIAISLGAGTYIADDNIIVHLKFRAKDNNEIYLEKYKFNYVGNTNY